jgi:hypothetical protein
MGIERNASAWYHPTEILLTDRLNSYKYDHLVELLEVLHLEDRPDDPVHYIPYMRRPIARNLEPCLANKTSKPNKPAFSKTGAL